MIIQRYLIREVVTSFVGVLLILFLILVSATLISTLAKAIGGEFSATTVLSVFIYQALAKISYIIPLSFYISILLVFGKLSNDSEMTAILAGGVGPATLIKALALPAIAVTTIGLLFSLWLNPLMSERVLQILDEERGKTQLERYGSGRFHALKGGDELFYIGENIAGRHSFFSYRVDGFGRQLVVAAGIEEKQVGDKRQLHLQQGSIYKGEGEGGKYQMIQFDGYQRPLEKREVEPLNRGDDTRTSLELYHSELPEDIADLQWRTSIGLGVVVLALVAVPLGIGRAREGRYLTLFIGLMLYLVYSNLLISARSRIMHGEIPAWIGLWWVHLLFILLALSLLWRQNRFRKRRGSL